MGGNAIKVLQVTRLEKKYYDHVAEGMATVLREAFPKARIEVIEAYRNKESFGDLDVLISGVDANKLEEFCVGPLNSQEIHRNGGVISFAFEVTALLMKKAFFQVDFITVPEEDFDFALQYFAFNDLGNLIGQTAHGVGLKFGHDGLWYKYIVDTQLVKEICITKDFGEALGLLDYSYKGYCNGFDSLEEIFEYATASQFFSKWNYQLENRNHVGRIRDKKRKTYMAFLEWMDKQEGLNEKRAPKDHGFLLAAEELPHIAMEFIHATLGYFRKQKIKRWFNGELVGEWTQFKGKGLGRFMADYKGSDHEAFLSRMEKLGSGEAVKQDVLEFYRNWVVD